MEIAEVRDRESLEGYLGKIESETRFLIARYVAFRAAARVLPIALASFLNANLSNVGSILTAYGALAIGAISGTSRNTSIQAAAVRGVTGVSNSVNAVTRSAFSAAAAATAPRPELAAASSASMAALSSLDTWPHVRLDLEDCANGHCGTFQPIWNGLVEPARVSAAWAMSKEQMQKDLATDWSFWILWYERVRAGRDFRADKLAEILNPLREEDWKKGPAHINPLFDDLLALYRQEDAALDKQEATVADAAYFDFVEVNRQMRAVAFPSDHEAFATDEDKAAFLKSVTALRNLLEDWCELARAQLHGRNRPITVVVAVEQLLDQLGAIEQGKEVSLRDLVRKGSNARRTARDPALEENLGEVLYDDLKDALDEYSQLARLHLGDILAVLDALRSLELGDLDSGEVLASLKAGVARLEREETDALLPPDVRTRAILDDMIAELEDEQAEIAEGRTETARAQRGKRFAEKFGGVSATFGRYVEKGSAVANKGGERFDEAVKWYKRWQTLEKIVDWWNNLGGPTP